jgi:hypothetical protein
MLFLLTAFHFTALSRRCRVSSRRSYAAQLYDSQFVSTPFRMVRCRLIEDAAAPSPFAALHILSLPDNASTEDSASSYALAIITATVTPRQTTPFDEEVSERQFDTPPFCAPPLTVAAVSATDIASAQPL